MKATDFILEGVRGSDLPLAQFAGRPMLIVNTASLCGFTPQYAGLQELHRAYEAQGLVVLAVPSNDFGKQEPGDPMVCAARFEASFPFAGKAHVRGEKAIPLFQWLSKEAGVFGRPRWNFYKYVIGRDGQLLQWFGSLTKPESPRLRISIEQSLVKG